MKKKILTLIAMAVVAVSFQAIARDFNVTFKSDKPDQVIQILEKETGYGFVFQKDAIKNVKKPLSGTFKSNSIEKLLDDVVNNYLGLDYEIIDKTVVLRPMQAKANFSRKITGKVIDETGEPLIGAFVLVEGTQTGTATDIDGDFSLEVSSKHPKLVVRYVGMQPKEITINDKTKLPLEIRMDINYATMSEVVVTGYQNIKRENATGAYQTISSEEMDKRVSNSIVENLEGKIPGLISYNNGYGKSGEEAITIRGTGTFNAKSNPLVVVDGLPIEGGIETVNTYDIANITVLKDAAASSIYGARASNGVIVITTKQAKGEHVSVDFNMDWTLNEKQDYSHYNWLSSAQLIDLETRNFKSIVANSPGNYNDMVSRWEEGRTNAWSPVTRLLMGNNMGTVSDGDLAKELARLAKNDYRKEWRDAYDRNRLVQQYNVAMRISGKNLASSIMVNYRRDNLGVYKEHSDALTFKYKGDLEVSKYLDLSFGVNVINERGKQHIYDVYSYYNDINSFLPYYSMYDENGNPARMEAGVPLDHPALSDPFYELKPEGYNLLEERDMNWERSRRTNIRTYLRGVAKILPGWTASAHFQYEDIYYKSESYFEPDSYSMRSLFNNYTEGGMMTVKDYIDFNDPNLDWDAIDWDALKYDENWDMYIERTEYKPVKHYIPDGGRLDVKTNEGTYWTFRAQTQFNRNFLDKHEIDVLGGFEFRQTRNRTTNNVYLGYDDDTQTNGAGITNWKDIADVSMNANVFGKDYSMLGAPDPKYGIFDTSDILHRFYSLYLTGNYLYNSLYALSASVRVDKTDLFGADPKFRGRPLWSVGASWNAHNEPFMRDIVWISALKPRVSYGITGNIDSSVSSFLTATIGTRWLNGQKVATLDTAPNDQLRWEKTATWNFGVDFAFLNYRLSGSLDYYRKSGSDLLTTVDLDPTTGWTSLNINNGKMINNGVELQLMGHILEAKSRNQLGIDASFNFTYNHNEVTEINHEPTSGYENLMWTTFHKGYPVHSLFSYKYGGITKTDRGSYIVNWIDKSGNKHESDPVYDPDFTPDQAVYGGSLDPKYMMSFTPQITWNGFSLSAMMTYYGGHVMRYEDGEWTSGIGATGTTALFKYWDDNEGTEYCPNGWAKSNLSCLYPKFRDTNILDADYMKVRNIVLSYSFPKKFVRHIGINDLRLRFQMNNVATWTRNSLGIDPESVNPREGTVMAKAPKSYTFSLFFNL